MLAPSMVSAPIDESLASEVNKYVTVCMGKVTVTSKWVYCSMGVSVPLDRTYVTFSPALFFSTPKSSFPRTYKVLSSPCSTGIDGPCACVNFCSTWKRATEDTFQHHSCS